MGSQVLVVKVVRGPWCENERRVGMPVGVVKNSEKPWFEAPKWWGGHGAKMGVRVGMPVGVVKN